MADSVKTPINFGPCTIGELSLDLLLSENEKLSNKVTQFPVEDGSSSADHVVLDPGTLTITGFITNSPIRAHSGTVDGLARVTRVGQDQLQGSDINFTDIALAYLRKIRASRMPVTVITKRGTWENMLVEDFERSKDKETGDAMIFTIRLVEFNKVSLVYVKAPKRTKSARAQPRAKGGKKDKAKVEDVKSVAYTLEHGLIDFFKKRAAAE